MKKSDSFYSKKNIAMRYFPEVSQESASRNLRDWLHKDRDLLADLKATGYKKTQINLTPEQYKIFQNYVDEPL